MARQVPQGPFVRGVQLSRSAGFCTTQEAAALFVIHKTTFQQWRRKIFIDPRAYVTTFLKLAVIHSVWFFLWWMNYWNGSTLLKNQ